MRVAYVVRSWPRLSQTFVLGEVLALERMGVEIALFAMSRPDEPVVQAAVGEVRAPVRYLDLSWRERVASHGRVAVGAPVRYLATSLFALRRRDLRGGYTQSGWLEAFTAAVVVADSVRRERRLGRSCTHIHAHFAHDPTLVGLLAHRLTGLPFSFTAHARDLYQLPEAALAGRVKEATAVVTCCRANVEHIHEAVGDLDSPVELVYHGTDLRMFAPRAPKPERAVPRVVSVGRLVEKKGFDDLLGACAVLVKGGRRFTCEIHGDGPCRDELEALRDRLGLGDVVFLCGERTQVDLVPVYQDADVFVLTPRVTDDGDRDGVPNVLVEAMACGTPVVATEVGGVAELVSHRANGLLAPARDVDGIARCLAELLDDASLRSRLGDQAARTATRFDVRIAAQRLATLFDHQGTPSVVP
jgi:glycosyltransferase involved in cell wall biosynthesis